MTDYCTVLLNPATKSDILSACIQADAAIRVGHEQAVATSFAGWLTLIAGAGALLAGVLAYYAAIMGVRQAERRERLLIKTYRRQLVVQFRYVRWEINETLERLKKSSTMIIDRHDGFLHVLPTTTAMQKRLESWDELVRSGDLAMSLTMIGRQLFELLAIYRRLAATATETGQLEDELVKTLLTSLDSMTVGASKSLDILIFAILDHKDSRRGRLLTAWKRAWDHGAVAPPDDSCGARNREPDA